MKPRLCKIAVVNLLSVLILIASGCSSNRGIVGTYSDASGAWVLDLKSGGQATLTFYGDSRPCTYNVSGDQVMLTCKGERQQMNFTVHQDGSLTAQGFMPALRKSK